MIRFALAESGPVQIGIYDLTGRSVRNLTSNGYAAGLHEVEWDGRNDTGAGVASGVYFYKLVAGSFQDVRKLVVTK